MCWKQYTWHWTHQMKDKSLIWRTSKSKSFKLPLWFDYLGIWTTYPQIKKLIKTHLWSSHLIHFCHILNYTNNFLIHYIWNIGLNTTNEHISQLRRWTPRPTISVSPEQSWEPEDIRRGRGSFALSPSARLHLESRSSGRMKLSIIRYVNDFLLRAATGERSSPPATASRPFAGLIASAGGGQDGIADRGGRNAENNCPWIAS